MLDLIMQKAANADVYKECDFEDCRQYEAMSVMCAVNEKIWLHTYHTGKFNSTEHVRVYKSEQEAKAQHAVLGGIVKTYFAR